MSAARSAHNMAQSDSGFLSRVNVTDSNQAPYAGPWWARWRWQLPTQLLLLLISLSLFLHLAGAEPFVSPKLIDLWAFVGLPAIVGWMHCQMAFGFAYILARLRWSGAPYLILLVWSIVMAYLVFRIPSEYAVDLIKNNQLLR